MNDNQLLRYSRHILLDDIGIDGQEKLANTRLAVIGCGGLGCAVLPYLCASGIGKIIAVDNDIIELSNLQRQILYSEHDIDCRKVDVATNFLQRHYATCEIEAISKRVGEKELLEIAQHVDIILDCTDNFPTRYAINSAACNAKKPLVSGAVSGFLGQIAVFDFRQQETPCYACVFPDIADVGENCALFGVFAPLVGIIGTMQANETLKILLGLPNLHGKMQIFNAKTNNCKTITLAKNPDCKVCGNK
ncbi:MAG: HesA/MoeB/ThiF family protein [Neisseriaceae bacterium]|nr:HesA/MoeB/ThiF family protein [Neisseriaceae bacterium]